MPVLTLSILGGFTVRLDGRPTQNFRSQKARALLAYLVMEGGRPHERATLAALFWPEMPDAPALRNLSQTLIWLRQVIGDGDPPFLLLNRRQMQWNPAAAAEVDALRFLTLVERRQSPAAAAPDAVQEAVALYGGEFLAGFSLSGCPAFDDWLLVQREYFQRLALEALFRLAEDALAAGNYETAAGLAHRQLALDRWREESLQQLLHARAGAGRHAEALAEYENARRLLAQELNMEPQPETMQLAEDIRRGDVARVRMPPAVSAAPAGQLPPAASAPPPHNLPIRLTSLLGREKEMTALSAWLLEPETRLITISGIGGVGKTRLALAAASACLTPSATPDPQPSPFPDGVWFVPLAGLTQGAAAADNLLDVNETFISALAATLGLTFAGSESSARQLERYLRDRRLLLVLDNYEHLMSTRPDLLNLLHNASGVRVLITSREPLGVGGERVLALQGLPLPPPEAAAGNDVLLANSSARLFFNRALERGVELTLDETERPALVRICHLAEGLPLVIELAATWAGHFTCAEIAAEMTANLDFLSAETAAARVDLPARQRSPRAAFDYAWRLLSAAEQLVLAQLTLLHGPFSREAALAVTESRLVDLISLLNKSLLSQIEPGWYAMHSLVRQFAAEQLHLMPEVEAAARERQAAYFLRFLADLEEVWQGPTPQQARADIRPLFENIRIAWHWAIQHEAWERLDESLFGVVSYLRSEGLHVEGVEVLGQLVELVQPQEGMGRIQARLLARALSYKTLIQMRLDLKADTGLEFSRIAMEWARQSGDPLAQQIATYTHGVALMLAATHNLLPPDDFGRIRKYLEQALAFGRRIPETNSREKFRAWVMDVQTLNFLGNFCTFIGDRAEARRHCDAALALCHTMGNLLGEGQTCISIADLLQNEGDFEQALHFFEQALRVFQQVNEPDSVGGTIGYLCGVMTYLGDYQRALERGRAALDMRQRHGLIGHLLYYRLGMAAFHLGDVEQALQYAADALAETALAANAYQFRLLAGECYTRQERWPEAAEALHAALALAQKSRNPLAVMTIQRAQADLALAQGDAAAALSLVEGLLPVLAGAPLPAAVEPLRLYWTCYRALQANGDARAAGVLSAAHVLLHSQAALIRDATRRQTFTQEIAVNRDIASAFNAHSLRIPAV